MRHLDLVIYKTKDTKGSDKMNFVIFVSSLERCAGTIQATNRHEVSVIPAKAGIHPLTPLDAGLRRHDESREEPYDVKRATISYPVEERRLMDTSW